MTLASILVVETDPVIRERIMQELRGLGYKVSGSAAEGELPAPSNDSNQGRIVVGPITIDLSSQRVIVHDKCITIASREFRLLIFLLKNQDRALSRKQLLINVWDRDATVGARTVDVYIRRLRSSLEPSGCDRFVQTVRGTGYRFSLQT